MEERVIKYKKGFIERDVYPDRENDPNDKSTWTEEDRKLHKKPANRNIDWQQVMVDYCYGYIDEKGRHHLPTYEEIAKKHNVSIYTLRNKNKNDEIGWKVRREMAQEEVKNAMDFKKKGQRVADLTEDNAKQLAVMNNLIAHFKEKTDELSVPNYSEEKESLSIQDCVGIVNSLDKMHKLRADILGQPKSLKERLEADKLKAKEEIVQENYADNKSIEEELRELTKDLINIDSVLREGE